MSRRPPMSTRTDTLFPYTPLFRSSAVRYVLACVKAAVATGIVDEDRLGLTGQSYGGLETAFIITQTDIFKAAVAVDLDSDLLAAALQTYGDRKSTRLNSSH